MDENLNSALDSLGMLATVTNARKEYLVERRCRSIQPIILRSGARMPTKENCGLQKSFLYCAPGRATERFYGRRARVRCLPYDVNRRRNFLGFSDNSTERSITSHYAGFTAVGSSASTSQFKIAESAHLEELKRGKTEKFPVPVLLRSKSLEDLRNANSQACHQFQNLDNLIDFGTITVTPPAGANIKTEIDSMSMRIEKLDVA